MMPMLAQIPREVQDSLERVLDLSWNGVDVRVERIHIEAHVPASRAYAGLRYVVGRRRRSRGHLRVVGATIGETIFIDPDYAEWHTAAGQALLAHERWHVHQKQTIMDFDRLYAEADRDTPRDRPWENPYEYDAYLVECEAYHRLIARGMPRGSWVPLGVSVGLCEVPQGRLAWAA